MVTAYRKNRGGDPTMTAREYLIAAKNLLLCEGWTQGWEARDHYGRAAGAHSPYAVRFSAWGALRTLRYSNGRATPAWREAWQALQDALPAAWEKRLGPYNNAPERTLLEMLELFDCAIARTEWLL